MSFEFAPASAIAETGGGDERELSSRRLESLVFTVSATWPSSGNHRHRSRGRGTLMISPDSVVFYPSALTHKRTRAGDLLHSDGSVTVTTARLCPPWANTFVILQDRSSRVRLAASVFSRGKLRRALREAGFIVRDAASWVAPRLPEA